MEPVAVVGMAFVLILVAMTGGFILLFPISRRFGAYLERRLDQDRKGIDPAEMRQLRASIAALQGEVEKIAERQEFTESLLSRSPEPQRLAGPEASPRGG